jgi:hypothetical protein
MAGEKSKNYRITGKGYTRLEFLSWKTGPATTGFSWHEKRRRSLEDNISTSGKTVHHISCSA